MHRADYHAGEPATPRTQVTTALMAATGMGGGMAWIEPDRDEREALTLEAVKLAVELGVDVNAANSDGRTALDAAKALKYEIGRRVSGREGRQAGNDQGRAAQYPASSSSFVSS